MKKLIVLIIILSIQSCIDSENLDISKIQNSEWLIRNLGECSEKYSFSDSIFTTNHCELTRILKGSYWHNKDTLFLYYPKLKKDTVTLVSGEKFIVEPFQMNNYLRPTLKKLQYKNDTLFYIEEINNYNLHNETINTEFTIDFITRLEN